MDTHRDAVIRPRLRRDAVLHPLKDAAVLRVRGETMWLAGADAYRLLSRLFPHLTGERTVQEICAGVAAANREMVSALIHGLVDRGAAIDVGGENGTEPRDARFRAQYEYVAHASDAPAPGFRRWRTARILLVGNGVSLQAVAVGLLRNGAGPVSIVAEPGWPFDAALAAEAARLAAPEPVRGAWPPRDGDGHDAVLYCADRAEPQLILEMVRRARGGGPPMLAAAPVDGWAVLGPVTGPGRAGCWWCAAVRLGVDPARPADPTGALTPTVARMIGGALAFTAFGELTAASPGGRFAVVQQLRTLEATRLEVGGGCPVCRDHPAGDGGTLPVRRAAKTEPVVRTVADMPARTVREYSAAVHRLVRNRPAPADFEPDWSDQPAGSISYPTAPLIALPEDAPPAHRPFAAPPTLMDGRFNVSVLAWLLRMSYGRLSRRVRLDTVQPWWAGDYAAAAWRRGAVSGGGLYPLEIYWVAGEGGAVPAGTYHYAPGHHALERLAVGDRTARVRQAVPHREAQAANQFLLITLRFWRNAFKYANLAYHIGTIDVGALLGTLGHLGASIDLPVWRLLWFDDQALNEVLDLDVAEESVLAVVPMPWQDGPGGFSPPICDGPDHRPAAFEESRTVVRFACTAQVHRETMWSGHPRPAADTMRQAAIDPAPAGQCRTGAVHCLPEPAELSPMDPVSDLLLRRRSSFGALVARPPLGLEELGAVLRLATRTSGYRSDTTPEGEPSGWTRLSVLANHVESLAVGGYRYDPVARVLRRSEPAVPTDRWLDVLAGIGVNLSNYDLNQAAAVLVVSGRPDAMLDHAGSRGYRLLNADVGTVAQNVYLAAAALGLGCGAVLNLDHVVIDEVLGFDGTDERALLCLLIGGERDGGAEFDHRLY